MWWTVESAENVWDWVEPLLQRACKKGKNKYTADDFKKSIKAGDCQLWVYCNQAAAITDVITFPNNKKIARINIGMGDLKHLPEFINTFELWAQDIGCDGVQSTMRTGFAPEFKKNNWKPTHILLEKEFTCHQQSSQ